MFSFGTPVYGAVAERKVLSNGVILLHSEKKALPIVKVIVAIKAGSTLEPGEKAGVANLTADLLNEGTLKRSSREISEAIEYIGGSLSTSGGSEYITVTLSVLKKDVDLGFELLSDVILHPAFREDEIARRKAVIKSSIIQQKEDPGIVASKTFLKAVFGENPYGRPVEGTEETIDGVTRSDILSFYKTYYAPNNSIIAIVGDISEEEITTLVNKYFREWQRRGIPAVELPSPPAGAGPRVIKIYKDITQSNIILGHIGINRDNPDFYAVQVMNYILGGGGFASRLMDNIRDNKGLSYDVHSLFSANKDAGYFEVVLQTKNKSANSAIDEVIKEMEKISGKPVTDKELDDAKSYLTGSFPLRIDSNNKIASFLISVEFYNLGLNYAEEYKKLINAVSKADVMRVARKYLNTRNYILVVVGGMEQASLK